MNLFVRFSEMIFCAAAVVHTNCAVAVVNVAAIPQVRRAH